MNKIRKAIVRKIKLGTVVRDYGGWQEFNKYYRVNIGKQFNFVEYRENWFQLLNGEDTRLGTCFHISWLVFIDETLFDFE